MKNPNPAAPPLLEIAVLRCKDCSKLAITVNNERITMLGKRGHYVAKCSGMWETIAEGQWEQPSIASEDPAQDIGLPTNEANASRCRTWLRPWRDNINAKRVS